MKAHKKLLLYSCLSFLVFHVSCSKEGSDFIDNTSDFPLNWKASDAFEIIGYNGLDSIRAIRNSSVMPFGTKVDANFGTFRSSFYASYQTTLTSKTLNFNTVDSIVLIVPYFAQTPKYGAADKPFSVEVYEMTESIETDPASKKVSYSYSPTVLGSRTNFIPAVNDSTLDGSAKAAPSIRIQLNTSLANKIVAPGTYASDADFQSVLKGLYVRSSGNTNTNGFVLLSIGSDNVLRIYGKNASGTSITADFTTGGSNSTTINEYLHDKMSQARITSLNTNPTIGDNLLYSHGLNGYAPVISLPDLSSFSKNKSIFKAELSLYSIDTGLLRVENMGLMYLDSLGTKEFVLPDELYKKGFLISIKDTTIAGQSCKEYKYNIAMHINRLINNPNISRKIRVYSAPLIISSSVTKYSDFLPSSVILGGTGSAAKPKLKIYYTEI